MRAKSEGNGNGGYLLYLYGSERSALVAHAGFSNQAADITVSGRVVIAVGLGDRGRRSRARTRTWRAKGADGARRRDQTLTNGRT